MRRRRGLRVGEYEMECNAMAGCAGLGGDIRGPNMGMKVEVVAVWMECRKVEGDGRGRMI